VKRFFVRGINKPAHILAGENHRHVVVCRLKCGDGVVLCTGNGIDHIGAVENISKTETTITIKNSVINDTEPNIILDLFFSPLTQSNTELIIIKGTELGVSGFYPTHTKYTQGGAIKLRYDRLEKLILESAKQCGRARLPHINEVKSFESAVMQVKEYDLAMLCYEGERYRTVFEILKDNICRPIKKIAVFVGPEGGYHAGEITSAKDAGLNIVTLGKRILRAETASIASCAIILQDFDLRR